MGSVIGRLFALTPSLYAGDFTGVWRAAGQVIEGVNPYRTHTEHLPYPLGPLAYPLTAAIAALPLATLSAWLSAALFVGLSITALAYSLLGGPPFRLLAFGTPCFVMAMSVVQWSPLLTAAAVIPPLGIFVSCKPNLGLALFARRPSWWIVGGSAALVAVSLALIPTWPIEWLRNIRGMTYYKAPIAMPGGALLLLALLRWRDEDARMLFVLSMVPSNLFMYDQLPLFLIARSRRDMLLLFAGSWLVPVVGHFTVPEWVADEIAQQTYMRAPTVAFLFLPALYIILSRPSASARPDIVDRILNRRLAMTRHRRATQTKRTGV